MNCDLACHLIDDYLEKRLSRYDTRRLERHLSACSSCARELRERPRFERTIRQALAASVQQRHLSAEASIKIVQEAQGRLRRAVWVNRAYLGARVAASAAAICLVLVGLLVLLNGIPAKSNVDTITLFPSRQLSPSNRQRSARFTQSEPTWSGQQPADLAVEPPKALSLGPSDVLIEPWMLEPGEAFTITLSLHTNLPQPVDSARFDLDVNGPTGYYRFEVTVKGPLPAHGVSVLQITPDILAAYSREKYLLSPTEIFGEPGVYTVQIFLFSPISSAKR
jgi:hypothetical protein